MCWRKAGWSGAAARPTSRQAVMFNNAISGFRQRVIFAGALLFCAAAAGAEPRFSFHSTPGKLPKDVVPKHYALRIAPAATHERFEGRAQIEIEVARPVAAIELNAVDLDFDAARLNSAAGSTLLAAKFDRARE